MKIIFAFLLSTAPLWASPVPISTSTRATPIGWFNQGDVVEIRYLKGTWSRRLHNPPESPDSTPWKELRVVVFWENEMGVRMVAAQPYATASNPHRMRVMVGGNYFIRMAEPREEGVGVVFYEIKKVEANNQEKK